MPSLYQTRSTYPQAGMEVTAVNTLAEQTQAVIAFMKKEPLPLELQLALEGNVAGEIIHTVPQLARVALATRIGTMWQERGRPAHATWQER